MAIHCPECGIVNPEGANYCQKCGAYLGGPKDGEDEPTTMTYTVDDTGEMQPIDIDDALAGGGASFQEGARWRTPFPIWDPSATKS